MCLFVLIQLVFCVRVYIDVVNSGTARYVFFLSQSHYLNLWKCSQMSIKNLKSLLGNSRSFPSSLTTWIWTPVWLDSYFEHFAPKCQISKMHRSSNSPQVVCMGQQRVESSPSFEKFLIIPLYTRQDQSFSWPPMVPLRACWRERDELHHRGGRVIGADFLPSSAAGSRV